MLTNMDPWLWRFVLVVSVGMVCSIATLFIPVDALLQVGRVLVMAGGGALYACYLASRFFGHQGAKLVQGVFLAAAFFLTVISLIRLLGGSISADLAVVQLIGFMAVSMLFSVAIMGFGGLMASNTMRVRSGKARGLRDLASAALAALMMYSGFFPFTPEVIALGCAITVVILQTYRPKEARS